MKKYKVSLNKKGALQGLISNLRAYEDGLDAKCEQFVSRLADIGIQVGRAYSGQYGEYITFRKEMMATKDGCTAFVRAFNVALIEREWKTGAAVINPLLMAEFGSGWKAVRNPKINGVGQGTFPGQTHAFDPHGWFWEDKNSSPVGADDEVYPRKDGYYLHHSYGEAPTMPMYHAWLQMEVEIQRVAREVFG